MGRRILLTGLDTFWGGRVAAALEHDDEVEMLLGMGTGTPSVELERTEYVRTDNSYSLLSRIVKATEVDTIVHTFLVLDSSSSSARALHETNVIGTMNLLAAAGASQTVRQVVVKSSSLVYGSHPADPAWFAEQTARSRPPRYRLERSLCEVESYVTDFAEDNPSVAVSVLRFSNVLGADIDTPISRNLARGLMPQIAGFDPLVQFVEEDDVVRCVEFVVRNGLRGTYNVAGEGKLPVSEVAAIAGARLLALPPFFTAQAAAPLVRARLLSLPLELHDLLRYGRGIDTSKLARAGFAPRATAAGAVERFARASRLRRTLGDHLPRYRYEADVEAFFRHSPAVVRRNGAAQERRGGAGGGGGPVRRSGPSRARSPAGRSAIDGGSAHGARTTPRK